MIVVIGDLALGGSEAEPVAAGLAGRAARAAASAGAHVEVVSKVGEGPDGDTVLIALAMAGVGHVATLRDATDEYVVFEFSGRRFETLVFPRKEMVAATEEILTDNGIENCLKFFLRIKMDRKFSGLIIGPAQFHFSA